MNKISANELKGILKSGSGIDLIDVRTAAEFEGVHVTGARLVPLDGLPYEDVVAGHSKKFSGTPIYILCHSGARAAKAAEKFAAMGFDACAVIEGGTVACVEAGLPVTRGDRTVIPLDRQLQITIGTIVLSGVILSKLVNPSWVWLAAFAGCGLIFAGLTGICPMRSVIAKMPWNQGKARSGGSCCAA